MWPVVLVLVLAVVAVAVVAVVAVAVAVVIAAVVAVVVAAAGPTGDPPLKNNRNAWCLLQVWKMLARP